MTDHEYATEYNERFEREYGTEQQRNEELTCAEYIPPMPENYEDADEDEIAFWDNA